MAQQIDLSQLSINLKHRLEEDRPPPPRAAAAAAAGQRYPQFPHQTQGGVGLENKKEEEVKVVRVSRLVPPLKTNGRS